jgi:archaemetzincin
MKRRLLPLAMLATAVIAQDAKPAPAPGLAALRESAETLRSLMQEKTKPRAGDWLAEHEEPGQTFDQYMKSRPNRPTAKRTTLYIQPIGDFSQAQQQLVKDTAELMGVVFGVPVKTLDPLADAAIPDSARRTHPTWGMKQFLSTYILDEVLLPRRPEDAVAVLGLTATDLYP